MFIFLLSGGVFLFLEKKKNVKKQRIDMRKRTDRKGKRVQTVKERMTEKCKVQEQDGVESYITESDRERNGEHQVERRLILRERPSFLI